MSGDKKRAEKSDAYYRLHTGAVNDLVSANAQNTPRYSREELEKYTSRRPGVKLSARLKVALIKAWFYGAVCYFVFWGMGLYIGAQLDLIVIAGLIMGMVTDLLINTLLRFMEKQTGESRRFMMVTLRGVPGFLLNLLYGGVLMLLVVSAYAAVNLLLRLIDGTGALFLGVGPVGFGVIAAAADHAMIACRHMMQRIIDDARRR